jgi:type VI secretion system ImpM family protein
VSDITWFVYGKHPKFADYFSIGDDTQFTAAYTKWVVLGFQQYIRNKGAYEQICSYRFWSKADSSQTLAVGLLRSSTDSLGRPFPLLFIGTALLPYWQKRWNILDKLLDQVWAGVETIAGDGHASLQNISAGLAKISLPVLVEHKNLQQCSEAAPNAVFTGGCGGRREITRICFTNPLTTQDFIQLWSIKSSPSS